MNTIKKSLITLALLLASAFGANAQYYQIANQVTDMVGAALSGGFMYRGMVDVAFQPSLGENRVILFEATTTQGIKYADWFYMGVGMGATIINSNNHQMPIPETMVSKLTDTGCMIPLYSDFRFSLGGEQKLSFYIDLRIGASFLVGSRYVQIGNGYLNNTECFYLKPSVGLRMPINSSNPKMAFKAGVVYNLITTGYYGLFYNNKNDISLSTLGINVGFEW